MEKFGHYRFYEILDELAELHSIKNKDYATQNDPLRNFKESGKQCQGLLSEGNEAIKICLVYMQKQIDAVKKLVSEGKKGGVENIATRLKDVAVYSVLGMILFEETFKEINDFNDSIDKFLNQEPIGEVLPYYDKCEEI